MAGEVVVDALPYFDQGYDEPGVREAVCGIKWFLVTFCHSDQAKGDYFFIQ